MRIKGNFKKGNEGVSMRNDVWIRYVIYAALFTGLLCTAGPAWAGGFYLNEFASPSSGTAQAGAEAVARDASTVWHNPAGMTRVEGKDLLVGAVRPGADNARSGK
jgi:long-chain fatty acid transport protein